MQKKTPSALMPITRRHSSSVTSTVGSDAPGTPAEQTRTSIGPSSSPPVDGSLDVGRRGDVAGEREHAVRAGSQVEDATCGATREHALRDGRADAARPARDECHPPRESLRVAHALAAKPSV